MYQPIVIHNILLNCVQYMAINFLAPSSKKQQFYYPMARVIKILLVINKAKIQIKFKLFLSCAYYNIQKFVYLSPASFMLYVHK